MGKKSKRHGAQAGAVKPAAGSLINNKTVCKVVEELWTKTQGQAPSHLSGLWREYDAVVALTDSLKEKQGPSPSKLPASREEGYPALYQWLRGHNAEFDKIEIGSFGGVGYGVKATADIEMGERVMRIPEKLMMTSETAKTSQLGPLIARDRMLQVMPNVALALHLLNERYNPKSFWKPYIDILPATFSLPLWFDRSQLELLAGSPCLSDSLQHIRSVGKLYSHLHKLLRAHGDTSLYLYSMGFYYEDFVWAVSAVMSRQNEIPHERDEKQSKLALIPLWDMCNHWLGTISTDFNADLRTCDCFSPSAVKTGKELRIFYGARSNAELFLHQGFVYPPNTGDTLRIKLGLSSGEDSVTKSMKSRLLTKLDIPLSGVFHVLAAEDPFTPQLKAFVRVFTAKSDDLQRYEALSQETLKTELLADKWGKGDIKAIQFLIQRCELLLKAYRSTLFEDFEKVTQSKLDSKTHQALMLTICERCILGSATKMAAAQKVLIERGRDGRETNGTVPEEEEEEGEEEGGEEGANGGEVCSQEQEGGGRELPSRLKAMTHSLSAGELGCGTREMILEERENGESGEGEMVEGDKVKRAEGEMVEGDKVKRAEEVGENGGEMGNGVEGGEVGEGEGERDNGLEEVKEEEKESPETVASGKEGEGEGEGGSEVVNRETEERVTGKEGEEEGGSEVVNRETEERVTGKEGEEEGGSEVVNRETEERVTGKEGEEEGGSEVVNRETEERVTGKEGEEEGGSEVVNRETEERVTGKEGEGGEGDEEKLTDRLLADDEASRREEDRDSEPKRDSESESVSESATAGDAETESTENG